MQTTIQEASARTDGGANLALAELEEPVEIGAPTDPWWVKASLLLALMSVALCTFVGALTLLDWLWGR